MTRVSHVWTHPITGGRLFVGGYVSEAEPINEVGITHVVSLTAIEPRTIAALVGRHHYFPMEDEKRLPDARTERVAVTSIVAGLESGEAVLVHCVEGVNRAPYLAIRTLITLGFDPLEAVRVVSKARAQEILTNRTFLIALLGGTGAAAWQVEARGARGRRRRSTG